VNALVPVEGLLEGPPVTLGLHVPGLGLPLLEEVRHPLCEVVVVHHISKVIKGKILDLSMIPVGEANHIGCAQVPVLSVMSCSHCLETVADLMTIKLHQHPHQGDVLGRNVTTEAGVRIVTERHVVRGLQPIVESIDSQQGVELV
jgi:hypothetical protein